MSLFLNFVLAGFNGMTIGKSIGSGTIIDPDGTILTCAHVVVDFHGLNDSSKGKVGGPHFILFVTSYLYSCLLDIGII